ncbi:hypothetical protein [Rhizobium rosettiformans]|uniref:hypothetical protein n=1 Tax=Rhizobium rosettiformans TaxID=1368430 RepID=UPI0028554FC6|nr:hypothetical protein [Rhizobium rosettiformans]MDR7028021.1 hypothetical protein [Rhizobium rosettiformans]MDR7064697.1 hypothetical protein [Rhizobium rosettiformans]
MTLTEYGTKIGLGPRQVRKKLSDMGILQTEIEVRERTSRGPEIRHISRLTPSAIKEGLGRRLEPRSGPAYDVLTRKGQQWADERLCRQEGQKSNQRHLVRDRVCLLLGQGMKQSEISRIMGISRQAISRHAKRLAA